MGPPTGPEFAWDKIHGADLLGSTKAIRILTESIPSIGKAFPLPKTSADNPSNVPLEIAAPYNLPGRR